MQSKNNVENNYSDLQLFFSSILKRIKGTFYVMIPCTACKQTYVFFPFRLLFSVLHRHFSFFRFHHEKSGWLYALIQASLHQWHNWNTAFHYNNWTYSLELLKVCFSFFVVVVFLCSFSCSKVPINKKMMGKGDTDREKEREREVKKQKYTRIIITSQSLYKFELHFTI